MMGDLGRSGTRKWNFKANGGPGNTGFGLALCVRAVRVGGLAPVPGVERIS